MSEINTADVEKASDRAFRRDLNTFFEDQVSADRRAEFINEQAQYLIQPGQEYDPFTFEHFEEALVNAPKGDRMAVFATVAAAIDLKLDNHFSNHIALVALHQVVERYWLNCARQQAEKS